MAFAFSILAVILSFLAIFIYQWITLLPQLGIGFLYHIKLVRLIVALISLALGALGVILRPDLPQLIIMGVVILLTPLSGANHASRFLVSLDDPEHVPAGEAELSEGAELIAAEVKDLSHAWPLEQLIPHHITNDLVADQPVAAAW